MRDIRKQEGGTEYKFYSADGTSYGLWFGDDGKVKYCSAGKKTEFTLEECTSYCEQDAEGNVTVFKAGHDGVDIIHLAIMMGEKRLCTNNEKAETRRHVSMSSPEMENIVSHEDDTEGSAMRNLGYIFQNESLSEKYSRLSPSDKKIAEYFWVKKLRQYEIAKLFSISEDVVQKRLSKIKAKLTSTHK